LSYETIRLFTKMKGKFNVKTRIKGTEGLTLIELVVVMVILGLMVLISIPNIGRWLPRYRLRSAVRDVASGMQLARLGAIKDNREWAIQYDVNAQTYTVLSDEGPDGAWGTADDVGYKGDASPWTQSTRRLADYRNVSFGDNGYGSWFDGSDVGDGVTFMNNRVEFNPDGTAGPDLFNGIVGSAYLRNNRGGATCARIRFTATGAIEVVHWDGDSWEP
jgi:prepilin-type N-terminal cleavage/methylation domain-containing protein